MAEFRLQLFELWAAERIQQLLACIPQFVPPAWGVLIASSEISNQTLQSLEVLLTQVEVFAHHLCRIFVVTLEPGKRCFANTEYLLQRFVLLPYRCNILVAAVEGVDVRRDAS